MRIIADTVHWADLIAENLQCENNKQRKDSKHLVAIEINPSGNIKIGSLREAVTADAVYKALLERGENVELICIANTFSPLNKVYPFLPESYQEQVGKPLSEIPCPCGACANYAEHFLGPAVEALSQIGIIARIYRTDEMYRAGRYNEAIESALTNRDTIAKILGISGETREPDWSPFNPVCDECGLITKTKVTAFNQEAKTVDYTCACGHFGTAHVAGGGKLDWLVEWPAKWAVLGVSVEIFGKDRTVKGGSYEARKQIAKEIYGHKAPYPVFCAEITTGKREIANLPAETSVPSTKAFAATEEPAVPSIKAAAPVSDLLAVMPPEFVRYLVIRTKPQRQIHFNPGQTLLTVMDEYERLRDQLRKKDPNIGIFESRIYELSRLTDNTGICQSEIPFKHMATIYQAARGDINRILQIVRRSGYPAENEKHIKGLTENVSRWLELYAPPFVKFSVKEKVPVQAATLSELQKAFLSAFAAIIKSREQISGAEYHRLVYSALEEGSELNSRIMEQLNIQFTLQRGSKNVKLQITPGNLFKAIYISLLGKTSGPRAGWFLSAFDKEFLVKRFEEASTFSPGKR